MTFYEELVKISGRNEIKDEDIYVVGIFEGSTATIYSWPPKEFLDRAKMEVRPKNTKFFLVFKDGSNIYVTRLTKPYGETALLFDSSFRYNIRPANVSLDNFFKGELK